MTKLLIRAGDICVRCARGIWAPKGFPTPSRSQRMLVASISVAAPRSLVTLEYKFCLNVRGILSAEGKIATKYAVQHTGIWVRVISFDDLGIQSLSFERGWVNNPSRQKMYCMGDRYF